MRCLDTPDHLICRGWVFLPTWAQELPRTWLSLISLLQLGRKWNTWKNLHQLTRSRGIITPQNINIVPLASTQPEDRMNSVTEEREGTACPSNGSGAGLQPGTSGRGSVPSQMPQGRHSSEDAPKTTPQLLWLGDRNTSYPLRGSVVIWCQNPTEHKKFSLLEDCTKGREVHTTDTAEWAPWAAQVKKHNPMGTTHPAGDRLLFPVNARWKDMHWPKHKAVRAALGLQVTDFCHKEEI